jgi:hypothetical protein
VEGVETRGDSVDDVLERFESLIADVGGSRVLPDLLDGIALGAIRWQGEDRHGSRDDEVVGDVPAGTIHEDHAVLVGEAFCGMGKEQAHHRGIDPREDERGHLAIEWTDGDEGVHVLTNDLLADDRAQRQRSPAAAAVVDTAKAALVLEEQPEPSAVAEARRYPPERFREVCLKAACAAGSCFT